MPRPNGIYLLQLRDSAEPATLHDVAQLEVRDHDNKCGREGVVDVVRVLGITATQFTLNFTFPNAYYFLCSYVISGSETVIPTGGLVLNFADFSPPVTAFYRYTRSDDPGNPCVDRNFVVYQPQAGGICDLALASPTIVHPDRGQANGSITVNATSSGNIEYRLDSGLYQSNNVFSGLGEGTYTITVRDDTGNCTELQQQVTLTEKYFRIAKLNGIEFKSIDSNRQNLDNRLFVNQVQPHWVTGLPKYCMTYFNSDVVKIQFQSTFTAHDILVKNYDTGATLMTGTQTLVYDSPQGFKYYETTLNFGALSGVIQISISPTGDALEVISEPINLISQDFVNEYRKIQWGDTQNHSDMYWRSGIQPFIYVRGEVSETDPLVNKEVFRDCAWNLRTQSRELIRRAILKIIWEPYYIIEKVQWATGTTLFFVDDIAYTSEEGLEDREQPSKLGLANATMMMEQLNVFTGELSTTPTPDEVIDYLAVNPEFDGLSVNDDDLLLT